MWMLLLETVCKRYKRGYKLIFVFVFLVKGLVNLQNNFFKFLLIEKPGMRKAECQKPHKKSKMLPSYEGFKI